MMSVGFTGANHGGKLQLPCKASKRMTHSAPNVGLERHDRDIEEDHEADLHMSTASAQRPRPGGRGGGRPASCSRAKCPGCSCPWRLATEDNLMHSSPEVIAARRGNCRTSAKSGSATPELRPASSLPADMCPGSTARIAHYEPSEEERRMRSPSATLLHTRGKQPELRRSVGHNLRSCQMSRSTALAIGSALGAQWNSTWR